MSHSMVSSLNNEHDTRYASVKVSNDRNRDASQFSIPRKPLTQASSSHPSVKYERTNSHEASQTSPEFSLSTWKVGWKIPSTMLGLYLLALVTALTHLLMFKYLDGRPASNTPVSKNIIPQTWAQSISHLLATIFRASLCASLSTAFAQYMWRIFRVQALQVSTIELLHRICHNFFFLFYPNVLTAAPLLFLLALVTWVIPIAVIYPPGALTVGTTSSYGTQNTSVSTFNPIFGVNSTNSLLLQFQNRSLAIYHTSGGYWQYQGTRLQQKWTAKLALQSGQILPSSSPCGPNCTYALDFDGPYFQCKSKVFNETVHQVLEKDLTNGWLVPDYYSADWNNSWANPSSNITSPPFDTFYMNISRPFGALAASDFARNHFIIVRETRQIICEPGRATYNLNTTFTEGVRKLSIATRYLGSLKDIWQPDSVHYPSGTQEEENSVRGTLQAMSIYALIDSMVSSLAGTYPIHIFATQETSIVNFTLSNGTTVPMYLMDQDFIQNRAVPLEPNNTIIAETTFNRQRTNITSDRPDFKVSQSQLNDALVNVTLASVYNLALWDTYAVATTTSSINIYVFSSPLNLILPYSLCLLVSIVFLILGANSLRLNGVSAIDGGFLQVLMTTTGSRELERAAAGGCLGGDENVPVELEKMEIRFGELLGRGEGKDELRRAGFGTEEEVGLLRRGRRYGVEKP